MSEYVFLAEILDLPAAALLLWLTVQRVNTKMDKIIEKLHGLTIEVVKIKNK